MMKKSRYLKRWNRREFRVVSDSKALVYSTSKRENIEFEIGIKTEIRFPFGKEGLDRFQRYRSFTSLTHSLTHSQTHTHTQVQSDLVQSHRVMGTLTRLPDIVSQVSERDQDIVEKNSIGSCHLHVQKGKDELERSQT